MDRHDPPKNGAGAATRREFLSALGAAAAAAAYVKRTEAAGAGPSWFYDSFGNVVPSNPSAWTAGVHPPPLPAGDPLFGEAVTFVTPQYQQNNILLIMVDQMRQLKWLPPGGQAAINGILPNIASILNNSFAFPYFYSAATNCTPARAALYTGLYSQQTCMFKGLQPGASQLQPTLQTGYPNIGSVLSRPVASGGPGYATTWIGKWHVSASAAANPNLPGGSGPVAYGFNSVSPKGFCYNIPNPGATNNPYSSTYPSPDGLDNQGAGALDLNNNLPPAGYMAASPYLESVSGLTQLRDGAIADAFLQFLGDLPSTNWFTAVSFVNPHDMTEFPASYGLNSGNFAPPSHPLGFGYDSPPTALYAGDTPGSNAYIPSLAPASLYGTPSPWNGAPWNNPDDPLTNPYLVNNQPTGKPGLQAFQEDRLNSGSGMVLNQNGWFTFLNYYFWMQSCVDAQIGRVLTALNNSPAAHNTAIVFTSDHGDYAGSHNLHAKGGGLYDESINVPLYVKFPNQNTGGTPITVPFLCSAVDLLPFFYTLALGNESWRSNPSDPIYYLRYRESIFDAIHSKAPVQRRTVQIGANGPVLPYILHTTDELSGAEIPGTSTPQPSHAIAFRTVDFTAPGAPGGGKLGIYSYWPISAGTCANTPATQPATGPQNQQQFEFYDYTNPGPSGVPNYGEVGNQAFSNGVMTGLAMDYLNAFTSIAGLELYQNYQEIYATYTAAYSTYLAFARLSGCAVPPEGGA